MPISEKQLKILGSSKKCFQLHTTITLSVILLFFQMLSTLSRNWASFFVKFYIKLLSDRIYSIKDRIYKIHKSANNSKSIGSNSIRFSHTYTEGHWIFLQQK